jgi:exopolysaccharide production protein ExoZ
METSVQSESQSLLSLQILRAIAATMIVVHHGLHDLDVLLAHAVPWQTRLPLAAGVDLFFLISGFVMVVSTNASQGRGDAVLPFLRRRLARIWPIYAATTLLFAGIVLFGIQRIGGHLSLIELIKSLLFWPYSKADGSMQPLYGLGWTLNYEMMFYLLFALSLPLSRRLSRSIVIAALVVLVVAGQLFANAGTAFWFWSRPIILEFGLGVGLASLWLAGWRPSRIMGAGLIFAGLTALLVLQVLGIGLDRLFVAGMPMTLVLAGSLAFSGSGEATSHGATSRLAARIGDASYALYLLHPFVLKGLLIVVGARIMSVSPWLHLCIATILAIIASVLVWRYFERPLTRALQGPPLPR